MKNIQLVSRILFTLVFLYITLYFLMPTFAYGFWGLPITLLVYIIGIFYLGAKEQNGKIVTSRNKLWGIGIFVLVVYMTVLPFFQSSALFNASSYHELLGEVKIGKNFSKDVAPISTDQIRIVDSAVAYRLGDKVLGEQPSLGSQAKIGAFKIQKVKNKLYWVAPLLHSGFFKWWSNEHGCPGYVMVSATNERDVKLVQKVNGKDIFIKYQPGAFFSTNLKRHVYYSGYMTTGLTDYTFEIDDEGIPHWVISKYRRKMGFGGDDIYGVVVVNAETGEIKDYDIKDAPKWIDRIQPLGIVRSQITSWGKYVKGFWNLSNESKLKPSEGMSIVYGEDDKAYWYTGLTSVGGDQGTVGFLLVDTRTKEATWYRQTGATEIAAQRSAMGKVQEKKYRASFPVTYNIGGKATYVMPLKVNAGLIKMVAMVSVQDYSIVGVGNNLKECLRDYKSSLAGTGNDISKDLDGSYTELKGKIARFANDINKGQSFYYLTLEGDSLKRRFFGNSQISNHLPITKEGDSVTVKYNNEGTKLIDIVQFENKSID